MFDSDDGENIDEPRMCLLKRLVAGLLGARPKSVLSLPGIEEKLLGRSRASGSNQPRLLAKAFGAFPKAQSYSANPLAMVGCKVPAGLWGTGR